MLKLISAALCGSLMTLAIGAVAQSESHEHVLIEAQLSALDSSVRFQTTQLREIKAGLDTVAFEVLRECGKPMVVPGK